MNRTKRQLVNHLATLLLLLPLVTSCGPSLAEMENLEKQLIQKATTDVPWVKEFHELCPAAPIRLYFDRNKRNSATIQATDIIYDRYNLTLEIEIGIDLKTPRIISYGQPLIKFIEITSVTGDSNGPIKSSYGMNFTISQQQWRKIIEAHGLFSAAGFEVYTNEPVAGIEELKTYLRRTGIQ